MKFKYMKMILCVLTILFMLPVWHIKPDDDDDDDDDDVDFVVA